MNVFAWSVVCILVPSAALAEVTSRDCSTRLNEIASGKLSADDTLVLSDCAMAGYISADDIDRAYQRAKANRK